MKYLVFERTYRLESTPCKRCLESGLALNPNATMTRECWNCRGMGRKITKAGREVFYQIAELLGRPVPQRESRIVPKHFETIAAEQVKVGMQVGPTRPDRSHAPVEVTRVEELTSGSVRLTFADGRVLALPGLELMSRSLTDAEHDRVDAYLALRVGTGVVEPAAGSGGTIDVARLLRATLARSHRSDASG